MVDLMLPLHERELALYHMRVPKKFKKPTVPFTRVAYSAAHVVANPWAAHNPTLDTAIDMDKTIAYRKYLWGLGLGVAEAMDTAQRGMGLDWNYSKELIQESIHASKSIKGAFLASGAGTDHLDLDEDLTIDDIINAYQEQCETIEKMGGQIILMASRALAKVAKNGEDYKKVYNAVLQNVDKPVILHWLGDMFDPALKGYWGTQDFKHAMYLALDVINHHANKVDGIKISLLDKEKEVEMRALLPAGVKMYTGDDFNYAELIEGNNGVYSHALLGIFDAIAPAASHALNSLAQGKIQEFNEVLAPTVPLSRHIFQAPTRFYKTGVVFMAYLNGHQDHFTMINGQQNTRSLLHLAQLFRYADAASLFQQPEEAAERMKRFLILHGAQ